MARWLASTSLSHILWVIVVVMAVTLLSYVLSVSWIGILATGGHLPSNSLCHHQPCLRHNQGSRPREGRHWALAQLPGHSTFLSSRALKAVSPPVAVAVQCDIATTNHASQSGHCTTATAKPVRSTTQASCWRRGILLHRSLQNINAFNKSEIKHNDIT